MQKVSFGPFFVADIDAHRLPGHLAKLSRDRDAPLTAFALHVGGLNAASDRQFVADMNAADIVYADGASTVLVARAHGAKAITRAATTDIGPRVISELADSLGRTVRVGLVGGPPGLAERAGAALAELLPCEVVYVSDGYASPLVEQCSALARCELDVLFVGLGMPLEARAVMESAQDLPNCLVMTCGGWFGFLAGVERRAPRPVRSLGFEWAWRLMQAPNRLAMRYARGALTTLTYLIGAWVRRFSPR